MQQAVVAADAAVKNYCKRNFESAVYVHYPFRLGGEAIVVPETPVLCYRLTGNITNGAATITGLSSTSSLLVGMPVLQAITRTNPGATPQPFPNGVTIQSVDSSSQVTLTGNCTATTQTGTPFTFGLAVWLDVQGSFGDGIGSDSSGPFAASTLQIAGLHYDLQRDGSDGQTSKSGKLVRRGFGFAYGAGLSGSVYGTGWGGGMGGDWGRGGLSTRTPPLWPKYPPGSIKVQYAAGIGTGATAPNGILPNPSPIPADLTLAVNGLAAWCVNNADRGLIQVQSESFQGYSSGVAQIVDALKSEDALGSTRQLLSRWRKVAI